MHKARTPFPTRTENCPGCDSPRTTADGSTLRAFRRNLGLSMVDVAKAAGVSESLISQVERGDRPALPRIVETYRSLKDTRPHAHTA